ncbi:MAG: CARDB domain-containing protein [Thermoplasmata archaeon]
MSARLLPLLALALLVLPLPVTQGQEAVAVFITGPDDAGVGDTIEIAVTVAGGPAENNGSFIITAFLRGPDLTGATPLEDSPLTRVSENATFTFNVTMPTLDQFVELVVEGNSTKADDFSVGTATKQIRVLVPLQVSAQVRNTGSIEVRDIPAFLFIDDRQVAETEIDSLMPGESKTVSFSYLPVDLGVGTHTLEIRVDLNGDGLIDPAIGEVALRDVFTIEAEPINPLFIILGAIGAFVAALFLGAYLRRRRRGG